MTFDITVIYSPAARVVLEKNLSVPVKCTVGDALALSGLKRDFPEFDFATMAIGVWGKTVALNRPLQERDRVEIYRPLKVDPKVARRERFAKQGVKKSGLFAKRREGGKAGY
jgi:putative ubiquitin-RnfH superfamily antitoxin RatB of RatAB toxin-antitoxin module